MSEYNVVFELPIRNLDDDGVDKLIEQFIDFHPAVSTSILGWTEVTITVQAETLRQAIATALGLAGEVVSITAMTTAEFDRRPVEVERLPDLLSVSEMAEQLGVSRQAVLQRIESGTLPAVRIGKAWALPASAKGTASGSVVWSGTAKGRTPPDPLELRKSMEALVRAVSDLDAGAVNKSQVEKTRAAAAKSSAAVEKLVESLLRDNSIKPEAPQRSRV